MACAAYRYSKFDFDLLRCFASLSWNFKSGWQKSVKHSLRERRLFRYVLIHGRAVIPYALY